MRRKVVKQGSGSYTFSLPIGWIRKNNIEYGQDLDIQDLGSRLLLETNFKQQESQIEIDVSEYDIKTIRELIKSSYVEGITTLKISFKNQEVKGHISSYPFLYENLALNVPHLNYSKQNKITDRVKNITKDLIGFEVIEERKSLLVIKQIATFNEEDFNITMRRIYRLTKNLILLLKEFLTSENPDFNLIYNNTHDIKKFINHGMRLIKIGAVAKNQVNQYTILNYFELIAHHIRFISSLLSGRKKIHEDIISINEKFFNLIEIVENAHYSYDHKKYMDFSQRLEEFFHFAYFSNSKLSTEEAKVIQLFSSCGGELRKIIHEVVSLNIREESERANKS